MGGEVAYDGSWSEAAADDYSDLEYPHHARGHYRPAEAVAAASALHWVPYGAAVSAVRGLLGASHEDLRLRVQPLSRSLSSAVSVDGGLKTAAAAAAPFAAGARFPEGDLFVCADLPPLSQALQAVQRALMQVVVKDASHGA